MRWQDRRRSTNVEDRRGQSAGFGGGGMPFRLGGKMGLGGIVLIVVLALITKTNPLDIFMGGSDFGAPAGQNGSGGYSESASEAEKRAFVEVVLAETEAAWQEQFSAIGKSYAPPTLVLYSGYVSSACGSASSASGPFYCSGDAKVYLDMSFFDQLANDLGAQGDFAIAYVIAHEVGHHVQYQLGIGQQVARLKQQASEKEANALSVRMELQADYFAGVWANFVEKEGILEVGDIEEALNAASRIGDDVLQKQATGHAQPDTFTHGTAEQRARWLKRGYEYGTIRDGDTFSAKQLRAIERAGAATLWAA